MLDDDLEFENHVCVIELDADSPILDSVGLSREIGYEAHFEGTLYLSVMAEPGVDPFLRLETIDGERIAEDDDSGGVKHAFLQREVQGGEAFVIRVAVKGRAPVKVRFKLFEGKETDATRAAAKEGQLALADVTRLRKAGQLDEARSRLRDAVARLREIEGHESSTRIANVLWDMGSEAYSQLSDLPVARDAWGETRPFRESTLPDDHPDLQRARGNLAVPMHDLGDLHGARALLEKVLEVFSRTLPDDHPDLQSARANLAISMRDLGDLHGARALEEMVLEVYSRTLPDDHPNLQSARASLAISMRNLGDLHGAHTLLERVLEVRSRTLPDDHRDLQAARQNLAVTMKDLGDLHGARTLFEKVLEVRSRTLPDDHPDLQKVRGNLAATMHDFGDLHGARALEEKVLDVFSRSLSADHPDLQRARLSLATTMRELGDLRSARALEEKVLEVYSRTLPDDHTDLQVVRKNVARTRARQGEPIGKESHALVRAMVGALERPGVNRSGRELEAFAVKQARSLGWVLSADLIDRDETLRDLSFQAIETVRSAAAARERLFRSLVVPESISERARDLEERLARGAVATRQGIFDEGKASQDPKSFFAHIHEQDRLERELSDLYLGLAREQGMAFRSDRHGIAAALEPGQVAVGYWRYELEKIDPQTHEIASPVASYLAFVVKPDGSLTRVELGPARAIEDAVAHYRDAIGAAVERGATAIEAEDQDQRERRAGERLRALVLDPVLAHVGDAKRLIIALDDVLHLVPLGAMPLGEDVVAARYDIEVRASLKEITVAKEFPLNAPSLVALGGIEYDRGAVDTVAQATPSAAVHRGTTRDLVRSGPWALGFRPLEETKGEVTDVAALFGKSFESAQATLRLGREASRESLVQLAPRARFLHLATHGYFAPESVASMKDDRPIDARLTFGAFTSLSEQVRGFAPMELCGLALAGANVEPDRHGFIPGVITADEISKLDLRGVELVVLSACDTNVGERRAGQGIASLQQAVYAGGARASVTSLWKVPDQATRELMSDFYRRWWVQGKPKHQALIEAQDKMRLLKDELGRRKHHVKDWAAWVLVGES
ncbi:MAG: CHAT domain-containing tetratricopeptide repeat protein [Planctomycetota bacterium]